MEGKVVAAETPSYAIAEGHNWSFDSVSFVKTPILFWFVVTMHVSPMWAGNNTVERVAPRVPEYGGGGSTG